MKNEPMTLAELQETVRAHGIDPAHVITWPAPDEQVRGEDRFSARVVLPWLRSIRGGGAVSVSFGNLTYR